MLCRLVLLLKYRLIDIDCFQFDRLLHLLLDYLLCEVTRPIFPPRVTLSLLSMFTALKTVTPPTVVWLLNRRWCQT